MECKGNEGNDSMIQAKDVAEVATKRLIEAWNSGGCVDEHMMDQLIVFMALCPASRGTSRVLCPKPSSISSMHLETAIHFAQLLCGAKITVTEVEQNGIKGCKIIECQGVKSLNAKD